MRRERRLGQGHRFPRRGAQGRAFAVALLAAALGCSSETPPESAAPASTAPQHFDPLVCTRAESTAESLREKAERFDELAQTWHTPAGQPLTYSVFLDDDLETFDRIDMSDNVGSWTAMYAASQAFRYAVTKSDAALDNLRRVTAGEKAMMDVTGVRGLFSRVMLRPDLPGFPSEEELLAAYADCDLSAGHCKRYIEVTEGDFAGWWFKNDVSKDEYAAHMFAMAVAWELVDDAEVRATVKDVVTAVGDHLVDNGLNIVDVDGEVTTFGKMRALSLGDFPGFNALLSLSWLRLAATVGGAKYEEFYRGCLLRPAGEEPCLTEPAEQARPYTEHLPAMGLDLDCETNWNNHNMAQLAMYSLLRTEKDPALLATYRAALRDYLWEAEAERPMREQKNSLYTFFYIVNRDPADAFPEEPGEEAMCTLRIFPAHKAHHAVDTMSTYQEVCLDRKGRAMGDEVIGVAERGVDNFMWLHNPYRLEQEDEDLRFVESPEDYLLAYWMGRFFGFVTEEM